MQIPAQNQQPPGNEKSLQPPADHGERSYVGHGRLEGKKAVITGADSGIGRAVAIAFAREGADVVISYLDEHDDAKDTARWVEDAGRAAVLVAGDLAGAAACETVIDTAVGELGQVVSAGLGVDHPSEPTSIGLPASRRPGSLGQMDQEVRPTGGSPGVAGR